jgi:DNA repair exonuclease SbcCD ATPase subunit
MTQNPFPFHCSITSHCWRFSRPQNDEEDALPQPETLISTCAYPSCDRQPRPAEDRAGAKPKYCGEPDPVTGKPHTALTAFRRRQELARQAGGPAEAADLDRPVTMATARAAELRAGIRVDIVALTTRLAELVAQLDRTADPEAAAAQIEAVQAEAARHIAVARAEAARAVQSLQQAEADAHEARAAADEADAQLSAELAARRTAEQAAQAARTAAETKIAEAERAAAQRVLAAEQNRDRAIAEARREAEQASARASAAEQGAARAQQAAESAAAELERVRAAADRQAEVMRDDASRERERLSQAHQAQIAALDDARAELRIRAEHSETELARAIADLDRTRTELDQARADLDRARRTRRTRQAGGRTAQSR